MAPKQSKYSTTDFLVSFGPRATYLVRAPGVELTSTLAVSSDLQGILSHSKQVNFVIYPPLADDDNTAAALPDPGVAYVKKGLLGDDKFYTAEKKGFAELSEWLDKCWGSDGIQVVSNNNGGWWGLSSSGNQSFKSLSGDVRQLVKPSHPNGKVKHMALGVQGAYIAVFEDGHIVWDLKGAYDRLDKHLEGKACGELLYASLSSYQENIFFAAFTDGTIIYNFPQDSEGSSVWKDLDEKFLEFDGLRVISPSETLKSSAAVVKKPGILRQFTNEVIHDVAKKDVEKMLE